MATKSADETNGCTFQWKIQNISHCWLKAKERINSPSFIADAVKGTKWFLRLYPMEYRKVEFYLRRAEDCTGPGIVEVNYLLAFMGKDGSVLKEINGSSNIGFEKIRGFGFPESLARENVFVTERDAYLPEDTLTVQCTLWEKEQKPVKVKHLYARTVFKVNRRFFLCRFEKFSALKSGQNKFKDDAIDFDLVLNEGLDFEKKLCLKVNSSNEHIKYFSFKASIVDSEGKKENCGTHEYFDEELKKGVLCTLLFFKRFMENKSHYFPNDVLSLDCECVFSNGSVLYEYCGYGMISPKSTSEIIASVKERIIRTEESQNTSNIVNDLKFMYNDAICSNTVLRTSTRTFPAHKGILSARSPVFRSMFNNDMKEKNSEHVDITDFEDDTIHRMLLYMYTDSLEDLKCENASNLYMIADKYQILSLRDKCSSFLKDNLCPSNACDVLILADLHNDDELKCSAQDYILGQKKQLFLSQEWKYFMKTHTELAADVMCRRMYQE